MLLISKTELMIVAVIALLAGGGALVAAVILPAYLAFLILSTERNDH